MRKIMVVEDAKNIILVLEKSLKNAGYDVVTARDGLEAIEKAQSSAPNLILLDILIPKMNGFLVFEALQDDPKTEEIPVVFYTSKGEPEVLETCFKSMAADYCLKRADKRELILRVRNQLLLREKVLRQKRRLKDVREKNREISKLSTAVRQSQSVVVITDTEGKIEYVNDAFVKVTGYSQEEALGKNPSILKTEEHDPAYYKNLWETIESGLTWRGHFKNKTKSGAFFWERAVISPVKD
ncbi:MAG: response regulator, partial [Halanaerobiales bacterium]